jgi:hypothetical protein
MSDLWILSIIVLSLAMHSAQAYSENVYDERIEFAATPSCPKTRPEIQSKKPAFNTELNIAKHYLNFSRSTIFYSVPLKLLGIILPDKHLILLI